MPNWTKKQWNDFVSKMSGEKRKKITAPCKHDWSIPVKVGNEYYTECSKCCLELISDKKKYN